MSEEILQLVMYFSVAVTSFSLFLLIAAFRGKNLTDWLLLFRDLFISLLAARFFVTSITDLSTPSWLRALHWFLMTIVSIALFISLVDRNLVERIPIIIKKFTRKSKNS